ncbi:MAG: aminomethyl-transferring glycine dehydrogenase subunit GcvPB, partial [Planctomycetota bacterium]|nr:aminomethyl-transferring glycine dehydrogenase subunit GcvPB [Planctomycetota bacterium]
MTSIMETRPKKTRAGITSIRQLARGDRPVEPVIFEKSVPGQRAVDLPPLDVPRADLPPELIGAPVELPEVG